MIVVMIIFMTIVGFGAGFLICDAIRRESERQLMHELKEMKATKCPYEIEKSSHLEVHF